MSNKDRNLKLSGNRSRCTVCGEVFNSVHGFDSHRVGVYPDRRCYTIPQMEERGFKLSSTGYWITASRLPG